MGARLLVQVPATTANLGPGFDCLALALNLWNRVVFDFSGDRIHMTITGEGKGYLAENEQNLTIKAFKYFMDFYGIQMPAGIQINAMNQIPTGSGLGSSASAIIAGLLAANAISASKVNLPEILNLAAQLEGHADNAAAALWGGLVIVAKHSAGYLVENIEVEIPHVVVVVPEFHLPTAQARKALPLQVNLEDAVFNMSRTAMVVEALRHSNLQKLNLIMQDRLHQPYRLHLIPGAEKAIRNAENAGSDKCVLSGAGPGLIAFGNSNHEQIGKVMREAFSEKGIPSRSFIVSVSRKPATAYLI